MSNESEGQQIPPQDKTAEEIRHKKLQTGELVITDDGEFNFPFLFDSRFLNSPAYAAITELNIPKITTEEVSKVVRDLQIGRKLDITQQVISTGNPHLIPEYGFGGWAETRTKAQFCFDPNNAHAIESLSYRYRQQIAHELNHLARRLRMYAGDSLLDALVFEGLATYYEEHWGNKPLETAWGHALTKKQLLDEWKSAQPELGSTNYTHHDWFLDIKAKKHPRWTGYALGNAIVDSWMKKHPGTHMREVIGLPSAEILAGSNFPRSLTSFWSFLLRR